MSVTLERDGALLWVTIARPDALNAIDYSVMEGLEGVVKSMREDADLRVVVLRGAGERAFVSGGDLRAFSALTTEEQGREMAARMKAILREFEHAPCWTIACINGDAYGGGCETLVAMDMRIAAEGVRFGWTQTAFAVPPGWGGLTRLVHLVGRAKALRWIGLEHRVHAREALAAGLVDEVVAREELEVRVRALAERLARQDREMIGELKRGALRALELPRAAAIRAELEPFARAWGSKAHHQRVAAFLSRKE
ncbi:MAG: enoyl-CoA hydratase/isomerase family protein [Myxococcota bacterium]